MAFPLITFKHTGTDEAKHLEDVAVNKLQALDKYVGEETDVRCEVEFQKVAPQNSGNIYRAEVNFWLGGKMYRAEATLDSFEKALDEVRNELDKELRRAHSKRESMVRRGGRKLKEMLRWGK